MERGPRIIFSAPFCLFYGDLFYGLLVDFVEWFYLIFDFPEIDAFQVDAAYEAVVHRAVVNPAVCRVGSRGPLGGAGNIGGCLALGKFDADGNVEIIEYLETLAHRLLGILLYRSGSLVKSGPYKSRRGSDIARQSEHTAARAERRERNVAQFVGRACAGSKVDVVVEVCHLPGKVG